jgi:primosomal protein N''
LQRKISFLNQKIAQLLRLEGKTAKLDDVHFLFSNHSHIFAGIIVTLIYL